ncbi:unnamed protein product [Phytophthora fragariaefolia]|uniref:Unnamed protein product n=1 Tax=Phytophthora fragariaefolia TaxID=1490495 RepID=A0A9W7CUB7_9STRA|nr:unnamed protein product [Phytophthora fragariaefolia]
MEEEEEETYGFGSFSEMFDSGAPRAAQRLDMGSSSRSCQVRGRGGGGGRARCLELTLLCGVWLGPFARADHRDEFLEGLRSCVAAASSATSDSEGNAGRRGQAAADAEEKDGGDALPSPRDNLAADAARKEEFRQMVRRYTMVDQWSEEGLEIANHVHAGTGYRLGPTTKHPPKFSADSEYRKKTVSELSDFLKRMNQEWSEAESQRKVHTKAKHSRNDDDLFEYTDTVTGAQIPPRAYEQRYLEYVKAHDVNPVLHMFPGSEEAVRRGKSTHNRTLSAQQSAPRSTPVTGEEAKQMTSVFMATLGVDISSSCIIDKGFFSAEATNASPRPFREEDPVFRAAVDSKRTEIWSSWGSAFTRVGGGQAAQDEPRPRSRSAFKATHKRSSKRRESIILANANELQSNVDAIVSKNSTGVGHTNSKSELGLPGGKRGRSSSQKFDTDQKSRLKARRQSIVRTVSLPPAVVNEAKQNKAPRNSETLQSARKSPRPMISDHGYSRKASALEMIGDEDSDLCQLCYSDQATVHMDPCDHAVCASCWSRLPSSVGKTGSSSQHMCPWDRDVVKAKLQENERVEKEEYYLALSKPLPQHRVEAATIRNYQVARELRWKKLVLQAIAEQQKLDAEESIFRQQLVARPRRSVNSAKTVKSKPKFCRPSCAAARADLTKVSPRMPRRAATEETTGVFERLYKPQIPVTAAAPQHKAVVKRISIEDEAAFVARQERDQIDRQVNFNSVQELLAGS